MLTSSRSQVTMASNKVTALGFIVLMSMGLANAARVARYSSADGTGTGGGWGGGYVNRAGSGSGSVVGSGESSTSGVHTSIRGRVTSQYGGYGNGGGSGTGSRYGNANP